jgi:DNA-binding NarL/FixJ family response regulator
MNGVDAAYRIRHGASTNTQIVTMHDSDQFVQDALDAGASAWVFKADAARTLIESVRTVSANRSAERTGDLSADSAEDRNIRFRKTEALTPREREVLTMLANGKTNKEVGRILAITTKTVATHRARIMAKLQLHSISALVRYAIRSHLIDP